MSAKISTALSVPLDKARKIVGRLISGAPESVDAVTSPVASVREVLKRSRQSLVAAAVFSGFINVLALSSSLFMLQVYDRALPSRNLATLQALVVLVVALFAFSTLLENVRTRLFARLGRFFDLSLKDAVYHLNMRAGLPGQVPVSTTPFRDLEQVRGFLAGGGPSALFDLPWMPIYVILMFMLHPLFGVFCVTGIISLTLIAWRTDKAATPFQSEASQQAYEANMMADSLRQSAETVVPLGMAPMMARLWTRKSDAAGVAVVQASDVVARYGGMSRFVRTALQSLSLAIGAYLVIKGQASSGVMIAASILLGRALAPGEAAITHWRGFVNARQSYRRLEKSLVALPQTPAIQLPLPTRTLEVKDVAVALNPEAKPLVSGVSFTLQAGDGLGVIGPSGAGKSSLVRAIVGVWPISEGKISIDGSTLSQWSETDVGRFTGYLPQAVDLFAGTIAQNIARFDPDAASETVLKASSAAGVDRMVRAFEKGFETDVGPRGAFLSAGQRQRIALARALYRDPFLVVMDEPNASLDNEGEMALLKAVTQIRQRGGIVIMVAHRLNVLQATNKVLVLEGGQQKAFGPRDDILKRLMQPVAVGADGAIKGGVN